MNNKKENTKYILKMEMPEALGYLVERPVGIPITDDILIRRINILQFKYMEKDSQISSVITSLSDNCMRCNYHYKRYLSLYNEIRSREIDLKSEIFWDSLIYYIHFEVQSMFGSIRIILDELIYLIGRLHDITHSDLKAIKGWHPNDIFSKKKIEKRSGIDEFNCFPKYKVWYEMLTAYRNAFFHHGWLHGNSINSSGTNTELFRLSRNNAFLLPDWESIEYNSRPFEWSWDKGYQLPDIVDEIYNDFKSLFNELLNDYWKIEVPAKGTLPVEEHPNLVIRIVKPLIFASDRSIIPIFSNLESAKKNVPQMNPQLHEIAELKSHVDRERSIIQISLHGISKDQKIRIFIDPIFKNNQFHSENYIELNSDDLSSINSLNQFGISIEGIFYKLYIWRALPSTI